MTLPTSLSPVLLGKILRYVPGQRRKIETALQQEFPDFWAQRSPSDNDFYGRLHHFLQEPERRAKFNEIARKSSTKKRSLAVPNAIHAYYLRQQPDILGRLSDNPTPSDILHTIAEDDDLDRLANVAWAFHEDGAIDINALRDLFENFPALEERFERVPPIGSDTPNRVVWETTISKIRALLDECNSEAPDTELASLLLSEAKRLYEVANIEQRRSWDEMRELFATHQDHVEGSERLVRVRDRLLELEQGGHTPSIEESVLATVRDALIQYQQQDAAIREAGEEIGGATFAERQLIIERMTLLHQKQETSIQTIERTIDLLLQSGMNDASNKVHDDSNNWPRSDAIIDSDQLFLEDNQGDCDFSDDKPTAIEESERTEERRRASTRDNPTQETVTEEGTSAEDEKKPSVQDDDEEVCDLATQGVHDTGQEGAFASPNSQQDSSSTSLFDELLVNGHFARAYWVARVSQSFDCNILGALAEGARVKPGSSCHGQLAHFMEELTAPRDWNDDEQLLLVAAMIQPLVFLRTYPEAFYQIISTVPATPMSAIVERFRKTYISQGITLGPQSVQANVEVAAVEHRLQQLSGVAQEFLDRVPSIRFGYQPAERALRFLYGSKFGWRRLHVLVANGDHRNASEVRAIISDLDPKIVTSLHHQVPGLRQQLVGRARDKLSKHLHDTIALAVDWLDLVERKDNRVHESRAQQEERLKNYVISDIKEALLSLQDSPNGSASVAATRHRLSDVLRFLSGGVEIAPSIDDACLALPGTELDEDMMPSLEHGPSLISSMQQLHSGSVLPTEVFAECLSRDEFTRASLLIDRHKLGDDATDELLKRRDSRRVEVRRRLNGLYSKVEEAFLLGQLWDSGGDTQARTDLLSLADEGLHKLDGDDETLNANIRDASALGDQIERRMAEVTERQISYLQDEKSSLIEKFQETERGQSDRQYFETVFSDCLDQEDHITAFDLLDRARRAVDQGEPIARSARIAPSEHLQEFLAFTKQYKVPLQRGLRQCIEPIRKSQTVFGIPFAQIDRARRDEAIAVLNKWSDLTSASDVEEVCRFIGIPPGGKKAHSGRQSRDGLLHVSISVGRVGPRSPLPGFGSMLGSTLDIIVVQRPQEPKQIADFMTEIGIGKGKASIVLLTRAISSSYRVKWLQECVRRSSMALPLDSCLLMYLCGQRSRLDALFDIGLPHTWAQPYITKGETVAREMFVGRLEEARDIVDPNGGCIVFGGRQLGKSALLTHVRRENNMVDVQGDLSVVYLDVNDLGEPQTSDDMMESFWKRVGEHLVMEGAIENPMPERARRRRPHWGELVPNAIETALAIDPKQRIVLLLDETDKLLDVDSQLDFTLIRRLRILMASTERRFKVVLAGLQSVQRYNNWKNHPFAQLGREIVVDPLPPRSAEDLVVRPFRALGFRFETSELVCRILSMANYHPGLIQIFCDRLLKNLYKNFRQWNSILRKITSDDVLTIERDQQFREEVRDRFDWTLDLDDRYKVIAYGLVLSENPTTAKSATEFRELGSSWWSTVFEKLDAQDMRALLDEMVGLGVLLAEHDEDLSRRYRLRSPNLLRLLGPKEAIEGELLRIIESDRMRRPNPREFRSLIEEPAVFGPLTKEQEGYLSEGSGLFSLILVHGSAAMGLRKVGMQVREVMRSSADSDGAEWEEVSIPTTGGVTTTALIVDGLKEQLAPRQRRHRYTIINLEELVFDEELGEFLSVVLREMKKLCRSSARGKVFVILDPRWVWRWVCSELRHSIEEDPSASVLSLHPWTEGAVTNALDRVGSRTGSKAAASVVCQFTSGIHELVSDILERTGRKRKQASEPVTELAKEVCSAYFNSDKNGTLVDLGLRCDEDPLNNAAVELLRWSEYRNCERILSDESFQMAVESIQPGTASRKILELQRKALLEWLLSLGIIWPRAADQTEFSFSPAIVDLVEP